MTVEERINAINRTCILWRYKMRGYYVIPTEEEPIEITGKGAKSK